MTPRLLEGSEKECQDVDGNRSLFGVDCVADV
jgi:hypothetical protein